MKLRRHHSGPDAAPPGARALTTLLLISGAIAGCGKGEASEAPSVQTATVVRQNLRITADATGQLEPVRQIEVKSKASGEILEILVDTGDQVEAGALLARIDPRDVDNALNQAQADLDVARARLDIARSQMERSRQLLEAGVITEQENESRVLEFANAQAAMVRGETNQELARLRRMDVTIRAPLAGTILQKSVEEGMVIQSAAGSVSGGTTLMIMAALDRMQVRTLVDETDVGKISAGMDATVLVEAFPGRIFQGVVEKIEPQAVVQQNVTNFPVIVSLDNSDGMLKPGMNAEVQVLVSERPRALLIPNGAVVSLQEMGPAALVLGLDPDNLGFDRSVFAEMMAGAGAGAGAPAEAAAPTQDRAPAGAAPPQGAPGPDGRGLAGGQAGGPNGGAMMDSLRARAARGEISPDSMRALAQAARGGGGQGGGAAGAPAGAGFQRGAQAGQGGATRRGAPSGAGQGAVAFVVATDGSIQARPILIGVNDWDNTEVLRGLEEGEQVALLGAAQLQARRQEWLDRIRGAGGVFPGGGGMPRMR